MSGDPAKMTISGRAVCAVAHVRDFMQRVAGRLWAAFAARAWPARKRDGDDDGEPGS